METGVLVIDVDKDSPAAQADIRAGDLIIGFNETPVPSIAALHKLLLGGEIGVQSVLTVIRHTEKLRVPIIPGESRNPARQLVVQ